jgi:hypothetical protein
VSIQQLLGVVKVFTKGVLKIFINHQGFDIEEAKDKCFKSGYEALSFNGDIWVNLGVKDAWFKTPFTLSDFTGGL